MKTTILFAVFFCLLATISYSQDQPQVHLLKPVEFNSKINQPNIQILDVRTPDEFSKGFIEHAINMSYFAKDFSKRIETLDKSKPVYVYCQGGGRSALAAEQLKQAGFKEVYDLEGGYEAYGQMLKEKK